MKQVIGAIIVLVIVAIALTFGNCVGSGLGGGDGKGEGSGSGNGNGTENVTAQETANNDETEDEKTGAAYSITVVESDYFYNNDRIELEAIVELLQSTEGKYVVEIKEDKASLKAYNKLVDKLEEMGADYIEK